MIFKFKCEILMSTKTYNKQSKFGAVVVFNWSRTVKRSSFNMFFRNII